MKRLISVISILLAGLSALAQGSDVYARFASKAATSRLEFSYRFTSGPLKGSGNAVVQDACFRIEGNSMKLFCDGRSVWAVDEKAGEVVIDSFSGEGENLTENPALILGNLDEEFRMQSSAQVSAGGRRLEKVVLVPVSTPEIKTVTVFLATDASAITELRAETKDGKVTVFTFPSFVMLAGGSTSEFTPGAFDRSYVVTDLR